MRPRRRIIETKCGSRDGFAPAAASLVEGRFERLKGVP